jgi:glycosyltransferase involved in cell wall biosynthesis
VSPARLAVYRAMDALTRPLVTSVVCVAAALARDGAERALVIHNGIDLGDFDPAAVGARVTRLRGELGLASAPTVGFVGRLTPQKDPLAFVDTVARLRRTCPQIQGLIVGDGPLRAEVERAVEMHGLGASCRVVGERVDVAPLFALMDVFVLTSVSEGFPFVVLEAMAMERPVVATAVNGVPEIVQDGDTGVVVRRGDVPATARAILDILAAPAAARAMGRAGRRRVEEQFTAQRMVTETETLYRRLLRVPAPVAAGT